MHNIYVKEGIYDFIYQIPQIIYSSIISSVIDIIIRYFSLSQKYIIEEKNKKDDDGNNNCKYINIINNLKIKFILFFIFSFLFLSFFWYYISCFCVIYNNTQIYLIKDTVICFGLSLIYPIFSYLISGIFRLYSLKNKSECIYKFSNLIII